jgi:hypothetical protein
VNNDVGFQSGNNPIEAWMRSGLKEHVLNRGVDIPAALSLRAISN